MESLVIIFHLLFCIYLGTESSLFFKKKTETLDRNFIFLFYFCYFFCCFFSKALDIFFLFIPFIYVHMYHKYWYRKHIFYVGNIILFFRKYKEEIEEEGGWEGWRRFKQQKEKKRNEKKLYMKRNHIKSLRRKWRMLCNKLGNLKISMES